MKHFLLIVLLLILASCTAPSAQTGPEAEQARSTLVDFLTLLNTKQYDQAVPLYAGEYEALQVFNTEIDPSDHVALWTWACEHQLLRCLQIRSATLQHQEGDTYVFQVEFNNPDGSLFILGPCCGASETEMPPVSQFEFTVMKDVEGQFVVMNAPPYVP